MEKQSARLHPSFPLLLLLPPRPQGYHPILSITFRSDLIRTARRSRTTELCELVSEEAAYHLNFHLARSHVLLSFFQLFLQVRPSK